uniref:Frizzled A2 n=1 Tax=Oscarella carmela TaxID=386100 RepID=A0A0B5CV31_OSCCA|nr:frizzled A2 [Oscarella carmela]
MFAIGLILLVTGLPLSVPLFGPPPSSRCEEIIEPKCRVFYNRTLFPNSLMHYDQPEASVIFHHYDPLLSNNCSDQLLFLLCSRYFPLCTIYNNTLPPCREVCLCAKYGCEPVLNHHNLSWPDDLSCDGLPNQGGSQLCMHYGADCNYPATTSSDVVTAEMTTASSLSARTTTYQPTTEIQLKCRAPAFVSHRKMDSFAEISYCKGPCKSLFTDDQFTAAFDWLIAWSVLCLVCVLFSLPARCVGKKRFRGPEHAVFCLAICLAFVSIGYIVGASLNRESVACREEGINKSAVRTGETFKESAPCMMTFMLTYYFSMAAGLWWTILSLNCFLVFALQWTSKQISNVKTFYHFFVWFVSLLLSAIVFAMGALDGDIVANVCFPGNQNNDFLTGFVIIPIAILLTLGTGMFLVAISSRFLRLQRNARLAKATENGNSTTNEYPVTDSVGKPMKVRMFVFTLINSATYIILLSCNLYELSSRSEWQRDFLKCSQGTKICSKLSQPFAVILLKYTVILIPGIVIPFWTWAGKFNLVEKCYWTPKECVQAVQARQPVERIASSQV